MPPLPSAVPSVALTLISVSAIPPASSATCHSESVPLYFNILPFAKPVVASTSVKPPRVVVREVLPAIA